MGFLISAKHLLLILGILALIAIVILLFKKSRPN